MERKEKTKLDNFYFQRFLHAYVQKGTHNTSVDAALFEGKELKQQPPCIEGAGSRTNRQNISGPVQPPARFEGYRLPLRCINAKWDIGMHGRKLRINLTGLHDST